ncbi:hypothetical protein Tco_0425171 [Tanacetum coccineum]
MANIQELAEIIQAMLANNNIQDIAESDDIDVDDLPDNVEPANVPKTEETTAEQHSIASENNNVTNLTVQKHEIDDEDIPMAPFKRKKKNQIKITRRTRLRRVFDEDASDQEEHLDEDESDQEGDLDDGWV